MAMTKVALSGGYVKGNFGSYQTGADGTANVDTRDAIVFLANGIAQTLANRAGSYTTPKAPLAATAGQIVASAGLSNGTITISNQPDIMRQVAVVWSAGTLAVSAGNMSVGYVANDGQTYTENVALALAAAATATHNLSRGVMHLSAPVVTGLTGGASPSRQFNTTAFIAAPVDAAAQDYATVSEAVDGTYETGGWSDSTVSIGCVSPNTAPNGTHNFSLFYSFVAPVV